MAALWLLGDIPKRGAKMHGSRECMVFEGQRLNYAEFNARINRLAHSLLSFAFDGSKHLAVLAENCPQFMEIYFAAAKAGYVTVPLNFRLANNELTHILKDSEAKILFYGSGYETIAREIAAAAGI
ncbi:MAG: AMP-binding protein, partial [Firmicutes bacterium]|nr:AMP-binding protein [Bacillota bacterium]